MITVSALALAMMAQRYQYSMHLRSVYGAHYLARPGSGSADDWEAIVELADDFLGDPNARFDVSTWAMFDVPETAWSDNDAYGCTVSRSNERSLTRDYPNVFTYQADADNGLAVPVFIDTDDYADEPNNPHVNPETAESLAEAFVALAEEYPLYDEMDHSGLEMNLADEAWDAYIEWDLRAALSDTHGIVLAQLDIDPASLRDAFYGNEMAWEIHAEGQAIIFDRFEQIAEEIAAQIQSGWRPSKAA